MRASWSHRVRWALWRRWFAIRFWTRRALLVVCGRGIELHPDRLDGLDGEPPHLVRSDLAGTPDEVKAILLEEWGYAAEEELGSPLGEITVVSMLFAPQNDDPDDEYAQIYVTVPHGTPGAVRYWQVAE